MSPIDKSSSYLAIKRVRIIFALLAIVVAIFIIRLFYVQVIRYSYYHTAALNDQLEQYKIPATRGIIEAHEQGGVVPIVLNQQLYTLYADPTLVKNPGQVAGTIAKDIGGSASNYQQLLETPKTRYVVLAHKLSSAQSAEILSHKFPGVGTTGQDYRTYPQGSLASQVLGFVNNNGSGEYGIEQAMNSQLAGKNGQLKAITDANGVPLVANSGNIETPPTPGDNLVLTLDMGMQAQMEQILQNEYKKTNSQGLSALIMDPYTGKVKAMANYPTYNPADYQNVSNPTLFQNGVVDDAIEPGSTMKTLTTSAALDQGVIQPNETFYDPAHWVIDGFNITDIEQDGGPREQSIASILALSLNTGATWMLMQMSSPGGTQINLKGVEAWHNYMVNNFRLGQITGIEQGYESPGFVPPVDKNYSALNLQYANTSFGQGVQLTAIQMGAALSSVLNGGTYYKPTLIDQTVLPNGQTINNPPKILEHNVVASKVGQELIPLMQGVVAQYLSDGFGFMRFPSDYIVGGKTGTAQLAKPGGGYYSDIFNGTYVGFVGGDKPQYVVVVFNIKPNVPGYAGSLGGQPVFADLAHMLINEGYVSPKS